MGKLGFELEFTPRVPPAGKPTEPVPATPGEEDMPGEQPADQEAAVGMSALPISSQTPEGSVSLKLVNNLPYDLLNCWLLIGFAPVPAGQPSASQLVLGQPIPVGQFIGQFMQRPGFSMPVPANSSAPISNSGTGLVEEYHFEHLRDLAAGSTQQFVFDSKFQTPTTSWEFQRAWPRGSVHLPKLSRQGTASAWVIGRLKSSPTLKIDGHRSDFAPGDGLHLYIQEILPEDLPPAFLFPRGAGGADGEAENKASATPQASDGN